MKDGSNWIYCKVCGQFFKEGDDHYRPGKCNWMGEYALKDSGNRRKFDSGMVRDTNEGKILWHLVADGPMLMRYAEHLTKGAGKYSPGNWLKAEGQEEYDRFRESAYRHFMQWYYGLNPEEDHAAAVWFNINGAEYVKGQVSGT